MAAIVDQVMLAAAAHALTLTGQTITYHPDGGSDREITASLSYPTDHPQDDIERFRNMLIHLEVANNATTGIAASEFTRRDTVTVAPRAGADAVTKRLIRIVRQNVGFVVYEAN